MKRSRLEANFRENSMDVLEHHPIVAKFLSYENENKIAPAELMREAYIIRDKFLISTSELKQHLQDIYDKLQLNMPELQAYIETASNRSFYDHLNSEELVYAGW